MNNPRDKHMEHVFKVSIDDLERRVHLLAEHIPEVPESRSPTLGEAHDTHRLVGDIEANLQEWILTPEDLEKFLPF